MAGNSPSAYFVKVVNYLAVRRDWTVPLIIYLAQLLLRWFIYKDPAKFAESIEKLGEDTSFIGLSILIAAIIKKDSAFRVEFATNLFAATIIATIIFILLCIIAVKLYKTQSVVKSRFWKYPLLIANYFVGFICLSVSIDLL
jgi:hypothetical protein